MHFTPSILRRIAALLVVIGVMFTARARLVWELGWPNTLIGLVCIVGFYVALILGLWLWGRRDAG